MCIRAYLNGDGIGYDTHLSIFFVLMKGEYDPLLKWPFDYKVSLILVDQNHRRHIVQTFKPSPSSNSFKQPVQDMNVASGCPKFTELSVLDNDDYIKDDVMYIKCIVDTTRIFHPWGLLLICRNQNKLTYSQQKKNKKNPARCSDALQQHLYLFKEFFWSAIVIQVKYTGIHVYIAEISSHFKQNSKVHCTRYAHTVGIYRDTRKYYQSVLAFIC